MSAYLFIWGCVYLVGGIVTGLALVNERATNRYYRWGSWTIVVKAVLWPIAVAVAVVHDLFDR